MTSPDTILEFKGLLPFRPGLFVVNPDGSGHLVGNRCRHCDVTFFPARELCIECFRREHLVKTELDTVGRLYTYTEVHRATADFILPYIVGYVDLVKDGVRVFTPLTGCRVEDLRIGMKMELVFGQSSRLSQAEDDNRQLIYQFRPSGRP